MDANKQNLRKMKCSKCKGVGNIKNKHFTILNFPVATIVTILGLLKIIERRPGWVQEVKTCPKCKGTGIV